MLSKSRLEQKIQTLFTYHWPTLHKRLNMDHVINETVLSMQFADETKDDDKTVLNYIQDTVTEKLEQHKQMVNFNETGGYKMTEDYSYYQQQTEFPDGELKIKISGETKVGNWIDVNNESLPYILKRLASEGIFLEKGRHLEPQYQQILTLIEEL
jgi:hypothetical protein